MSLEESRPVYTKVDGEWVKQDAFKRIKGKWVRVSSKPVTTYKISVNVSNTTGDSINPTSIEVDTLQTLAFTTGVGYEFTDNIVVTGADYEWNPHTGILVINNAVSDVNIILSGEKIKYSITPTLTNVVADESNSTIIEYGGTSTLIFTAADGYSLPSNITVTGCSYTWDQSIGTLVISNPTNNVTISIAAVSI
jgi:hypothetical protein